MPVFKFNGIKVSGLACAVPSNIVPTESYKDLFGNDEVEKFIKMTGITQTRRTSKYQTASDLGYAAAEYLIDKKGVDKSKIGAVVFGTTSPDFRRPASAFLIQKRLGLSVDTAVFDISLGCSSLIYGLQTVMSMMASSDIEKAVLVLGDTAAKTTNPKDRASIMIVGEGSVALLLEKDDTAPEIRSLVRSDGSGYKYLIVPGGGYRNLDASTETEICKDGNPRNLHNSFMQGTSVFTFTITDVPRVLKDYFSLTGTGVDDYDCFAFHQANLYILKQIAKKIKIPLDKYLISIDRYGNTSGASPVVSLCDAFGDDETGRDLKTLLCGFGVGLSWGVTSLKINTSDIFPVIEDDTVFDEAVYHSVRDL